MFLNTIPCTLHSPGPSPGPGLGPGSGSCFGRIKFLVPALVPVPVKKIGPATQCLKLYSIWLKLCKLSIYQISNTKSHDQTYICFGVLVQILWHFSLAYIFQCNFNAISMHFFCSKEYPRVGTLSIFSLENWLESTYKIK